MSKMYRYTILIFTMVPGFFEVTTRETVHTHPSADTRPSLPPSCPECGASPGYHRESCRYWGRYDEYRAAIDGTVLE